MDYRIWQVQHAWKSHCIPHNGNCSLVFSRTGFPVGLGGSTGTLSRDREWMNQSIIPQNISLYNASEAVNKSNATFSAGSELNISMNILASRYYCTGVPVADIYMRIDSKILPCPPLWGQPVLRRLWHFSYARLTPLSVRNHQSLTTHSSVCAQPHAHWPKAFLA
jgi:hypothetical protein